MKELYIDVHNSDVGDVHRHRNVMKNVKNLKLNSGLGPGNKMTTVSGGKSRKSGKS